MPVTTFLLKLVHKKTAIHVYVDGNPGTGFKQTGTKMWQSLTNERYSERKKLH